MAYNPEEDIKVSDLPEKTTDVVSDDKLLVIDSEDANILKQVDASKVGGGGSGTGDMLKSVYDKNNDGVVDDAEALGGKPASAYAEKTGIKTINNQSLIGEGNITIEGGSGGDSNSKTFIIDENNDVSSIASLVVSWYREGKNPIIFNKLSGMTFILSDTTTERDETILKFNSTTINRNNSEGLTELSVGLWITYETATGDFRLAEFQDYGVKVLSTNMNYTTPYTPLFDGSPATKKYVDDAVAGGGGSNLGKLGVYSSIYDQSLGINFPNPNHYLNPKQGVKGVIIDYVATLTKVIDPTQTQTVWGRGIITLTKSNNPTSTDYSRSQVFDTSGLKQSCIYHGADGKVQYFNDCACYVYFTLSNSYGERGGGKRGIGDNFDVTARVYDLDRLTEEGSGSSDFGTNVKYTATLFY